MAVPRRKRRTFDVIAQIFCKKGSRDAFQHLVVAATAEVRLARRRTNGLADRGAPTRSCSLSLPAVPDTGPLESLPFRLLVDVISLNILF